MRTKVPRLPKVRKGSHITWHFNITGGINWQLPVVMLTEETYYFSFKIEIWTYWNFLKNTHKCALVACLPIAWVHQNNVHLRSGALSIGKKIGASFGRLVGKESTYTASVFGWGWGETSVFHLKFDLIWYDITVDNVCVIVRHFKSAHHSLPTGSIPVLWLSGGYRN